MCDANDITQYDRKRAGLPSVPLELDIEYDNYSIEQSTAYS